MYSMVWISLKISMYNPDLLVSCFNTVFCFFIETFVSEQLLTAEPADVKP